MTSTITIRWGENRGALSRLVEPQENASESTPLQLGSQLNLLVSDSESVVGTLTFSCVFMTLLIIIACLMYRKFHRGMNETDDEEDDEIEEDSQPIHSISKFENQETSVGVSIPLLSARVWGHSQESVASMNRCKRLCERLVNLPCIHHNYSLIV